jgi:hypothetical protein
MIKEMLHKIGHRLGLIGGYVRCYYKYNGIITDKPIDGNTKLYPFLVCKKCGKLTPIIFF